jgi:hypothetical protein
VKKEFGWRQARVEAVLYESFGSRHSSFSKKERKRKEMKMKIRSSPVEYLKNKNKKPGD